MGTAINLVVSLTFRNTLSSNKQILNSAVTPSVEWVHIKFVIMMRSCLNKYATQRRKTAILIIRLVTYQTHVH